MSKLLKQFRDFREQNPIPIIKIAEQANIDAQKLYRFNTGDGDLRNDDVIALYEYMNKRTITTEN